MARQRRKKEGGVCAGRKVCEDGAGTPEGSRETNRGEASPKPRDMER